MSFSEIQETGLDLSMMTNELQVEEKNYKN